MRPSFSLGIERSTRPLTGHPRSALAHRDRDAGRGQDAVAGAGEAEMHTSVVEVGTRVCRNIDEAREDIYELRREMIKLAKEHGLCWWPEQRILLQTGGRRRFIPTRATTRW